MSFDSELNRTIAPLVILRLVSRRPMCAYQIIKRVDEQGSLQWKEGTVYPCLHRLESDKLIRSRWQKTSTGRQGRFYSITPQGARLLAMRIRQWSRFLSGTEEILSSK